MRPDYEIAALGKALQRLRKRAGLRQQDVGARMGIAKSTVAAYERAGRNPRMEGVFRYLNAVGASLADLDSELNPEAPTEKQPTADEELSAREIRRRFDEYDARLRKLEEHLGKLPAF